MGAMALHLLLTKKALYVFYYCLKVAVSKISETMKIAGGWKGSQHVLTTLCLGRKILSWVTTVVSS